MVRSLTLLFVVCFLACTAPDPRPRTLYRDARRDLTKDRNTGAFTKKVRDRMEERYDKVDTLFIEGKLVSAEDLLYSAALLVTSDDSADLDRAQTLAMEAATLGEQRALPIAAEAEDKLLLMQGLPQRFGTQYAYQPSRGTWRLYAIDPSTTDEDRAFMGLPTLAEMESRTAELNEEHLTQLLLSRVPE